MEADIDEVMLARAASAVGHARDYFDTSLDYSPESLDQVESILGQLHGVFRPKGFRRLWKRPPSEDALSGMSSVYGAYIGEVFRRAHGGSWSVSLDVPGAIGVSVLTFNAPSGDRFFPAAKVTKRLVDGAGDNVSFYYQVLVHRMSEAGRAPRSDG